MREHWLCTDLPYSVVGRPELSSVGVTPDKSWAIVQTIQSGWGGQPGMLMVGTPVAALTLLIWVGLGLAPDIPPNDAQVPMESTLAAFGASCWTAASAVTSTPL